MLSGSQSGSEGSQGAAAHGRGHGLGAPGKVLQLFCQAQILAQLLVQPAAQFRLKSCLILKACMMKHACMVRDPRVILHTALR